MHHHQDPSGLQSHLRMLVRAWDLQLFAAFQQGLLDQRIPSQAHFASRLELHHRSRCRAGSLHCFVLVVQTFLQWQRRRPQQQLDCRALPAWLLQWQLLAGPNSCQRQGMLGAVCDRRMTVSQDLATAVPVKALVALVLSM